MVLTVIMYNAANAHKGNKCDIKTTEFLVNQER